MDRRIEYVISQLPLLIFTPNSDALVATESKTSERRLIGQLALMINLTPSYLRFLFKLEVGKTLKQHIDSLRLERAKHLAETTFKTFDHILIEVGAIDHSHFRRNFKQAFGCSLSECRNLAHPRPEKEPQAPLLAKAARK